MRIDGGSWLDGVANLGNCPTFGGQEVSLEVHLLTGEHDLYGREVDVGFVERLRDEQRFNDSEELVAQIHRDAEHARQILAETQDLS